MEGADTGKENKQLRHLPLSLLRFVIAATHLWDF